MPDNMPIPKEPHKADVPNKKELEKAQLTTSSRGITPEQDEVIELSEDQFKEIFGDTYFKETLAKAEGKQGESGEGVFRSEEYEFKKFIVSPPLFSPYFTKELQLSQLKEWEVPSLSNYISFAEECRKIGAFNTADFFFKRVFSYLLLKVSVNGFGRKELNTRREEVSSRTESAEVKKGGGFSIFRNK